MEDLKARFYSISAKLLSIATPITSMTAADYARYEILSTFNASQETSRKKLAEGHLYRKTAEVDEETVLLGELQRIMLNQATLDNEREVWLNVTCRNGICADLTTGTSSAPRLPSCFQQRLPVLHIYSTYITMADLVPSRSNEEGSCATQGYGQSGLRRNRRRNTDICSSSRIQRRSFRTRQRH
jgi:hypothetical protein